MSVKKELVSGVVYTAISKYSGIVISLVVAGVLARLISPDDFGIMAIATVIITFFGIFSDLGIAPALIQNKTLNEKDLSGIFSFTLWMALVISACFFFCSWPIAAYYENEILIPICQLLSLNLFFATVNIVPNALLFKEKQFKFIAIRSLVIQLAGGGVAVVAALLGAGLYALLINPIASSVLLFVISYKKYPQRARLTFGITPIRKIFSFSVYQFLFNVINYFSRNLDKLLIGKYMGMSPLGYYEKSYRLMMLPLQNISHVISPVMHPIFSEYQSDFSRLSSSYEKVVRFLSFIGFPLSVFLFFTAKELTLIVFGDQWIPSVSVFQILSLSVGIQIVLSTSGSIFQAANDTRMLFISGMLSSTLNVAAMLIGIFVFQTLEAVAWCICLSFSINFIQCYLLMYLLTFKVSMLNLVKQFVSPLLLSATLALILYFMNHFLSGENIFISFSVKGFIFALILIGYIQFTKEYNLFAKVHSLLKRN